MGHWLTGTEVGGKGGKWGQTIDSREAGYNMYGASDSVSWREEVLYVGVCVYE